MEDKTWGIKEASEYLGCSIPTLRLWTQKKKCPHIKIGYLTRFRKEDLDQWLDECQIPIEK
uniref:Putative DNA binding, helix-turn-helix domain containing protein n=1 Tax=viral metagenome TaxID=1070528 RepID=A0A6M3LA97_9ZZZZ